MLYRVELPVFCGPLDLLLHLVRQQEVDIHAVRITTILDQYLDYLKVLEALDLSDLGDFLVMASTLMEIKSRELLPREDVEIEQDLDPRDDLIKRLLEYKRYRDISRRLDRLAQRRRRMLDAGLSSSVEPDDDAQNEDLLDLGDIEVWSLTAAFARLLEEIGSAKEQLTIGIDRRNIHFYATRVLERAKGHTEVSFEDLFDRKEGRYGAIGVFVAILEMMKQGVLRSYQSDPRGQIVVAFVGDPTLSADEILAGLHRLDLEDSDEEIGSRRNEGDGTTNGVERLTPPDPTNA